MVAGTLPPELAEVSQRSLSVPTKHSEWKAFDAAVTQLNTTLKLLLSLNVWPHPPPCTATGFGQPFPARVFRRFRCRPPADLPEADVTAYSIAQQHHRVDDALSVTVLDDNVIGRHPYCRAAWRLRAARR